MTIQETAERKNKENIQPYNDRRIDVLLGEFLQGMKSRNYSRTTIKTYTGPLKKFILFLAERQVVRVQDVTAADLEKYRLLLVERNYSDPTRELYLRCVRDFFRHLEKTQRIFINPAEDIVIHRPGRKLQPVPTEEEVSRLLAQPDVTTPEGIRDRAYLETFYSTGVRLEELTGLRLYDPLVKQGRLRVFGKGRKERVVPLGRQACFWLRKYVKDVRPQLQKNPDEPALWLGVRGGRPLHRFQIQHDIKRYAEQAGTATHITAHSLRRACATHMLRNGAHPVQIQMLLGHATLHNLSQYLRVTITDMTKMHRRSKPGQ